MRRKLVVLGAVLAVGIAGTGSYVFWNGQSRTQYRTAAVERGVIASTISATGNINPVVSVQVGSQISGMIKELHADFNSVVKKDQLIARIDPQTYQAKVDQAQGDLDNAKAAVLNAGWSVARAEADLANARANVIRNDVMMRDGRVKRDMRAALFSEGGISQEERDTAQATFDAAVASLDAAQASQRSAQAGLDVAKAQLEAAKAQVAQKQAALNQAKVDLAYTFIRAPVDGTVVSRNVDVGQTVAASLQAPTLFVIGQDLTKMQVDTNVDEADIGRVALDQRATFTVDSYPGQVFRGRVVQIRQAPQVVQNVVTYDVVVNVDNPELKLKPGMTANVRILVARKESALVVPNAAFRVRMDGAAGGGAGGQRPAGPGSGSGGPSPGGRPGGGGPGPAGAGGQGGGRSVPVATQRLWVLKDNKPEERTVRTGLSDGQRTEIEEGLAEGDQVIVSVGRAGSDRPTKAGGPRIGF